MTKPIKPAEAIKNAKLAIPDAVIDAFNEMIIENMRGKQSSFTVKSAASRIAKKMGITTDKVYKMQYLDVEDIYRKLGWIVSYDGHERYEAVFKFSASNV